jgi:hypothetical protein
MTKPSIGTLHARAAEVSGRTCSKWVRRYRADGEAGLADRSSAPSSIPHRRPADRVEVIVMLRRLRMTGAEIQPHFLRCATATNATQAPVRATTTTAGEVPMLHSVLDRRRPV